MPWQDELEGDAMADELDPLRRPNPFNGEPRAAMARFGDLESDHGTPDSCRSSVDPAAAEEVDSSFISAPIHVVPARSSPLLHLPM
jgi:hypothetical protein